MNCLNAVLATCMFISLTRLAAGTLLIRKCCRESEILLVDSSVPSCLPMEQNIGVAQREENPEFPWWMDAGTLMPVSALSGDQEDRTYVEFGVFVQNATVIIHSTDESYSILHNGSLIFRNVTFGPTSYCADWSVSSDTKETSHLFVLCLQGTLRFCASSDGSEEQQVPEPIKLTDYILGAVTALISALTLGVYLLVPKLRNREFKATACHLICVLATEVVQAVYRYPGHEPRNNYTYLQVCCVQTLPVATLLWLNVLCCGVARSSRADFLSCSVFVWGVTAVHASFHFSVLIDWSGSYLRIELTDSYQSVNALHVPLLLGVFNTLLLTHAAVKAVRTGGGSQTGLLDRHRQSLTCLNLLLLAAVPSTVEAVLEVASMRILRATSVLLLVLLKPEAPRFKLWS